jgi:hypothetical protein
MKRALQILLVVIIAALAYFVVESISHPIRFDNEKNKRYNATIERLKAIRTAQVAYRSQYGKFTGSFDTLIFFMKFDSFKLEKQIGSMDDSIAVAKGLVFRETIKISVRDSLLKGFPIDSIRYVPFAGKTQFELASGEIETGSKVKVKVFEAKVHNDIILNGLDKQLIINLNDLRKKLDRYPGLQVGSITEANNNAGNWE